MDDILFTGTDEDQVSTTIEQLQERSDKVDVGEASFLLGMAIQRNVDAGTILLTQEAYAKAVLEKFGMVNARPRRHRPSRARSASRRKRFCRQRTPSFSSLPQVLSFTLAGARGRTSLTRRWCSPLAVQVQRESINHNEVAVRRNAAVLLWFMN